MHNKHATVRLLTRSKNLKQSAAAASCLLLAKAAVVQASHQSSKTSIWSSQSRCISTMTCEASLQSSQGRCCHQLFVDRMIGAHADRILN